jgi:hypothetical protein
MYSGVPMSWRCSVKSVSLGEPRRGGLGDAEVDDLGVGLPSWVETRTFDGLMSRWMMPLVWACWTAAQTWAKSSSRSRSRGVPVAVGGDRLALDQLHHEVGAAGRRRPGVETLRDVGVVHHRQRLALLLEACDDLSVSIPSLMIFSATRRRTIGSSCSARKTVPKPPSPILSRSRRPIRDRRK